MAAIPAKPESIPLNRHDRTLGRQRKPRDPDATPGSGTLAGIADGMTALAGLLLPALAASALLASTARGAEEDWALCGEGFRLPARPVSEAAGSGAGTLHLSADEGDYVEGGVSVFTGNVGVEQGTLQLRSDELVHTEPGGNFDARGNVGFWDEGVFIAGDRARTEGGKDAVIVEPATRYMLRERHAHGEAAVLTFHGDTSITGEDATYTTCNPGDADWRITASRIDLDRVEEFGAARNAWLEFKGLPVFYTPWISFPLSSRRKTGFLPPSFGTSSSGGIDLSVPYYFNLAPNYDATLTARTMSDRGLQAQGEFRFLSRTYGSGQAAAQYLPSDSEYGESRAALDLRHRHRWSRRWSTDTRFEWVSDPEYFEDLGTDLALSSRTHLARRADLNYYGDGWGARARLHDFQTLDRTILPRNRPYASLPQILAWTSLAERNRALNLAMETEVVFFERRSSVTGARMDLRPSVTWPIRGAGTFLVPKATLNLTRYALDGTAPGADDSPSRVLPAFSLDGGVFLERAFAFRDRPLLHTVEPRLYYRFVPFESQDDLPVFDTSRFSFGFAQLFRDDRFSGRDRIGDAHQATLALTSRLLDEGGVEIGRASIGQIRYFRDRKVTLPGRGRETSRGSGIVAEVAARPARAWRVLASTRYDASAGRSEHNALGIRYRPGDRRVLNAAYRSLRDTGKWSDLSFAWPLGAHWRAVGRWSYALDTRSTLEAFGGLEYEDCCWAFRAVARRFLSGGAGEYSNGLFFQIEFKGLTGVGSRTAAFLKHNIPGYENEF